MRFFPVLLIAVSVLSGCGPTGASESDLSGADVDERDGAETVEPDTRADAADDARNKDSSTDGSVPGDPGFTDDDNVGDHDSGAVDVDSDTVDGVSDTETDSTGPACVSSIPCAVDGDCPQGAGNRCNTALNPPKCQLLYCGEIGSACSDDLFCEQIFCDGGTCREKPCVPNCDGLECGVDSECLQNVCGTCGEDYKCESGQCVPDLCEPECGARECGPDPVCGKPCGTCNLGYDCKSGACVENDCVPECGAWECGTDPVCGKSCGVCGSGYVCDWGTCADKDSCLGDNGGSCKAAVACIKGCGDTTTPSGKACSEACLAKASPDGAANYLEYYACSLEACGHLTNAAEKEACISYYCVEPSVDCFWGCTYQTCAEMTDCQWDCPVGNDECRKECVLNALPSAQFDEMTATKCLNDACPACRTAMTEQELKNCYDCLDEASFGECWAGWSSGSCAQFGTTYTTCSGLQSCFENCDLTTDEQYDYDKCRHECAELATSSTVLNLGFADMCTGSQCPICDTEYASNECKTCRASAAATNGPCFSDWFICGQTGLRGCETITRCMAGCTNNDCANRCMTIGTSSGKTLYRNVVSCFFSECGDVATEQEWITCVDASLAPGGACKSDYEACLNDLS